MTKVRQGFYHRGRHYTKIYLGGMSRSLAEEKRTMRQRLAPQFLWAIHREPDGSYSLGRAPKKQTRHK